MTCNDKTLCVDSSGFLETQFCAPAGNGNGGKMDGKLIFCSLLYIMVLSSVRGARESIGGTKAFVLINSSIIRQLMAW